MAAKYLWRWFGATSEPPPTPGGMRGPGLKMDVSPRYHHYGAHFRWRHVKDAILVNRSKAHVGHIYKHVGRRLGRTEAGSPLQAQLQQLKGRVEQLTDALMRANRLQEAEIAARRLEEFTDAVTSPEPSKSSLTLTGEGLIAAAKTVAEMAGPIASAVTTILGQFP